VQRDSLQASRYWWEGAVTTMITKEEATREKTGKEAQPTSGGFF
jgi:hypothetical protein